MKVIQDTQYNKQFPELYDWNKTTTLSAYELAIKLVREIKTDLTNPINKRFLAGGLRHALNIIAEYAEI